MKLKLFLSLSILFLNMSSDAMSARNQDNISETVLQKSQNMHKTYSEHHRLNSARVSNAKKRKFIRPLCKKNTVRGSLLNKRFSSSISNSGLRKGRLNKKLIPRKFSLPQNKKSSEKEFFHKKIIPNVESIEQKEKNINPVPSKELKSFDPLWTKKYNLKNGFSAERTPNYVRFDNITSSRGIYLENMIYNGHKISLNLDINMNCDDFEKELKRSGLYN